MFIMKIGVIQMAKKTTKKKMPAFKVCSTCKTPAKCKAAKKCGAK